MPRLRVSYQIDYRRKALRELKALPGHVRAEARQAIRALEKEPRPSRAKELRGKPDIYRLWLAGRWRLAYLIDDAEERIRILRIRRKEQIDYETLSSELHEPAVPYDWLAKRLPESSRVIVDALRRRLQESSRARGVSAGLPPSFE